MAAVYLSAFMLSILSLGEATLQPPRVQDASSYSSWQSQQFPDMHSTPIRPLGRARLTNTISPCSPMDFGAHGDGTSDDTAALQRAVDACAGNGGAVTIPEHPFLILGTVLINTSLDIYGLGQESILLWGGQGTSSYPHFIPTLLTPRRSRGSACVDELGWCGSVCYR